MYHEANPAEDAGSRADAGRVRVHIIVSGLVQGVGYRYFALNAARKLAISGWVRNRMDGTVELEAQGTRSTVTAFIDRLKSGNEWSRVRDVQVTAMAAQPSDRSFKVNRDFKVA